MHLNNYKEALSNIYRALSVFVDTFKYFKLLKNNQERNVDYKIMLFIGNNIF